VRFETLTVAAVIATLSACSRATTTTATKNKAEITAAPTPRNAEEVVIYNYKFIPPTLTVAVGKTVTWYNRDIAPHTATHRSFGDEAFDSGSLGHLATFSHTFRTPGSYPYLCIFHQGMMGTIVVQ
jgi:plastocyanin